MQFIDNKNLEAPILWRNAYCFLQLLNILYLTVGGSINLNYVQTLLQRFAVNIFPNIIYRSRQHAGHCGFTHTTRSTKHISMRQTILANRILKCTAHMLLRYDIIKGSWPVRSG